MSHYPAFLELAGRSAVVVGGGRVAERKALALLKADAEVTLISPELTPRLGRLVEKGRVSHRARRYRKGDVKDAFLVVAATDSGAVNARVAGDAPCLCNVADAPELSNFIVPSVLDRGDLSIAVSTAGVSPALARSIRLELENRYGPEFRDYLNKIKTERKRVMKTIKDPAERRRYLKGLGREGAPEAIRKGSRGQGRG